tara:strand:- start:93 stop:284 length:192 start_codon:yes stop_codon:yes gene_type:complete
MYFVHRKGSNLYVNLSATLGCHQSLEKAKIDALYKAGEYDRDMIVTDKFGCKRYEVNLEDYKD